MTDAAGDGEAVDAAPTDGQEAVAIAQFDVVPDEAAAVEPEAAAPDCAESPQRILEECEV